jgi:hypothetical protein
VFAALDEKKEALDWLENAVNRGFVNYPFIIEYVIYSSRISAARSGSKTSWSGLNTSGSILRNDGSKKGPRKRLAGLKSRKQQLFLELFKER